MYLQGLWEFMAFYLVGVWNLDDVIVTHLDPEDYIRITETLTFTDTITSIPVNITIVDDLDFEPVEHFNISLSTSSDGYIISPGNELVPVYIHNRWWWDIEQCVLHVLVIVWLSVPDSNNF